MKLAGIIFTTLFTIASFECAAVADPAPELQSWHGYCYRPGETCSKLKRAADAAAEAAIDSESCDESCGEHCVKAKRDALALAEATAEAFAAADPEAHPCHAPGSPCSKAKREALNSCEQAPLAQRNLPSESWHGYCWRAGETCSKLKRAAEVVAEAITQPDQDREAESEIWHGSCWPTGEHCSRQTRALDDVNSLLDRILRR